LKRISPLDVEIERRRVNPQRTKMVFILVDLEFRKKARHLLTTKEVFFCFVFILFALLPWVDIVNYAATGAFGKNGTFAWLTGEDAVDVSGMFDAGDADPSMEATACNPKFPRTCVRP